MSLQTATGLTLSSTVTIEVHVEEFPFTSITVDVIKLIPMFEQVKSYCDKMIVSIPQLSELPPSKSEATILTVPVAFN